MSSKTAIYPGSFDPMTLGHLDVISRANKMFDKVIIAVGHNTNKVPFFDTEERVSMLEDACSSVSGAEVDVFSGLAVDFAKAKGASVIIRGLRTEADMALEMTMAQMNKQLSSEIETIFIPSALDHLFVSSSLVKEVAHHRGDLEGLVPRNVAQKFRERYA